MNRIKYLEENIEAAKNCYYNTPDESTISDQAFDAWVQELRTLDPKNKLLSDVGAPLPASSEWQKATHQIPMGSLDKVNTPEEFTNYARNKNCKSWFVTQKLDGISIELVYDNGNLINAITRGDGFTGFSITPNVRKMQGVQSTLQNNFTGSVRGEIIMLKSIHESKFSDKANPRNAAAGVAKRIDGTDSEYLTVMAYQVIGDVDLNTEVEQFEWLNTQSFITPPYWVCSNPTEVNELWRNYQDEERQKLDYDIDGLVISANSLEQQTLLGFVGLYPVGKIAMKFDNQMVETTVREINWFTGPSGRITPVATVDSVVIVGATVTYASLYNQSNIEELRLDVGATVIMSRANDVVPKIFETVKDTGTIHSAPKVCPSCGSPTVVYGENLECSNQVDCPAQRVGKINNYIKDLNLLEWGDVLVSKLVESGKVKTPADLYKLTVDDLASIDRMGKKSAKKCYDILWSNTEVSLDVFLGSLSMKMIGISTVKQIMSAGCDTLEKFQNASVHYFESIPGVGPVKAECLYLGLKQNKDLIDDLLRNGIKIKENNNGKLKGQSFCFTGAMVNKRPVLEKMATDAGADVKNSVIKGLTWLVSANPNSGSSKTLTAKKMNVKLISEEEFLEMIG